jgi:hypothetical protein
MYEQNLNESAPRFIVMVAGTARTAPMTRSQAEAYLNQLNESEQRVASMVAAASNGNQLLLG